MYYVLIAIVEPPVGRGKRGLAGDTLNSTAAREGMGRDGNAKHETRRILYEKESGEKKKK